MTSTEDPPMRTAILAGAASVASIALLLLASPRPAAGAPRGPATGRERARAVRTAHELEADPLSEHARDDRRWLTFLLVEAPDLHVDLCPELLGGTPAERKRLPAEVVVQTMYSGAAFLLEHPDRAQEREEVYLAGLLGALRTYEAMLAKQPWIRSALLDDLLKKREAGELPAWTADRMAACAAPARPR
jgi:hypothetical protein